MSEADHSSASRSSRLLRFFASLPISGALPDLVCKCSSMGVCRYPPECAVEYPRSTEMMTIPGQGLRCQVPERCDGRHHTAERRLVGPAVLQCGCFWRPVDNAGGLIITLQMGGVFRGILSGFERVSIL